MIAKSLKHQRQFIDDKFVAHVLLFSLVCGFWFPDPHLTEDGLWVHRDKMFMDNWRMRYLLKMCRLKLSIFGCVSSGYRGALSLSTLLCRYLLGRPGRRRYARREVIQKIVRLISPFNLWIRREQWVGRPFRGLVGTERVWIWLIYLALRAP